MFVLYNILACTNYNSLIDKRGKKIEMILDGKIIAGEMYKNLKGKISQLHIPPCLGVILVGDEDTPSLRYIRQKRREAKKVGINFHLSHLGKDISEEELILEIKKFNVDASISGYIVQLPLPAHIDPLRIIRNIDPKKDVDGFHPENQGKIMIGDTTGLAPCTPAGVMKLFEYYNISLSGKNICILGQSNIVGKPMAMMCINAGATVSSCNHLTPDISFYTRNADIVISATGCVHLVTPEKVKKDAIIIDIGFSVENGKIFGDADYKALLENGNTITPVPGGIGPMTVAMLLDNTYKSHII